MHFHCACSSIGCAWTAIGQWRAPLCPAGCTCAARSPSHTSATLSVTLSSQPSRCALLPVTSDASNQQGLHFALCAPGCYSTRSQVRRPTKVPPLRQHPRVPALTSGLLPPPRARSSSIMRNAARRVVVPPHCLEHRPVPPAAAAGAPLQNWKGPLRRWPSRRSTLFVNVHVLGETI